MVRCSCEGWWSEVGLVGKERWVGGEERMGRRVVVTCCEGRGSLLLEHGVLCLWCGVVWCGMCVCVLVITGVQSVS